jgi:ABC-2 type transport system permease protein
MTVAVNTVPAVVRRAQSEPDRAGLRQAMRSEWTKLISLRSTKWALLITFAVCVLGTFLNANGAGHHAKNWYQGFDPTNEALGGLAFSSLVIAVLSVLCMTGEYSSGTIRSSLAATPRRSVFYGAKVLVFGLVSVVLGFLLCFLSFFLGQAILKAGGAPTASLSTPGVLHVLVLSSLFFALLSLFGFGLGAIIRHTAGAIAAFYGATLLTALILQSVPGNPGRFTPVMIFGNSVAAVIHHGNALSSTTGFLLMAAYTAVVVLAGGVLLAKRDA